jgi:hypothetical protein
MKKTTCLYIVAIATLGVAVSCEKDMPTWSGSDRINFETAILNDTIRSYSFLFEPDEVEQYTLWITVCTEGAVCDYERTVTVKQVPPTDNNEDAVPGVHYVAFDDPQLKVQYVIPSGAAGARLPIVLLRNPSLQTSERTLRIVLEGNEYFLLSTDKNKLHRTIVFADKYTIPKPWGEAGDVPTYFGAYGDAKYAFMIEATHRELFDERWFEEQFRWYDYPDLGMVGWFVVDSAYMRYLQSWLQAQLDERNAGEGEDLKEKDDTVVNFYI